MSMKCRFQGQDIFALPATPPFKLRFDKAQFLRELESLMTAYGIEHLEAELGRDSGSPDRLTALAGKEGE